MKISTIVQLVLLGMIWGSSFLFQRIVVPVVGAGMTAAARMLFAAVTLSLVLVAMRKPLQWRARWRDYLVVGIGAAGLPFVCFAFAAYSLPAGYLAVLNSTVPLFTVLIVWIAGARPSASKIVGVIVGVVGVCTLARFGSATLSWQTALAFCAGLVAAALYAISARAARRRFPDVDPLVVAAGNMIGGALPLIPVAAFNIPAQLPSLGVIGALLMLGVVCTAVAFALYFRILRDIGYERAVTVTFLVPVFAQTWGALFLHEPITLVSVIGCGLVLFAVALIFERIPGFARPPAMVTQPHIQVEICADNRT